LHKIPNICLGKLSTRQKTLLFFPQLYQTGSRPNITQDDMKTIYNNCIRPTIAQVLPHRLSHWPPSYEMAFVQAQDVNMQLHLGTIEIPSNLLTAFTTKLTQYLEQHPNFKDCFFYHEWRGMKGGTAHDGAIGQQVDNAFNSITADLDLTRIIPDDWYADVAMELHAPGKVLMWATGSHPSLLRFLIPNIRDIDVTRLMRSKNWQSDTSALIYSLAGFRSPVSSTISTEGIAYINVYTTEKQPTYQLHYGAFRRHIAQDILPTRLPRLLKDIVQIGNMFGNCRENCQEGCVRVEVRIPLSNAKEKLRQFSLDLARDSIVVFNAEEWW
jgi:hypothetical protein